MYLAVYMNTAKTFVKSMVIYRCIHFCKLLFYYFRIMGIELRLVNNCLDEK